MVWILWVAIVLALCASCARRPRDPVSVARTYLKVGESSSFAGLKKCYPLLSSDSRKVATLDEYFQHFGASAKGNGVRCALDTISLMPDDKNLPTYRRVRAVAHFSWDTLQVLNVSYYTLVNENGLWSVVWEMALLDQAADLYQKGMLDEAIALCDKAIALNPYSAAAYDRKAWCYDRQKAESYDASQSRVAAIEANAKKAVALEPENPDHYSTLSLAYDAQDLPELVIEADQRAIHLPTCTQADRARHYSNIARTYLSMEHYDRAIASADSALALDPSLTFALMQRAKGQWFMGLRDSARMCLDRALNTDWTIQLDKGLQFRLLFFAAYVRAEDSDYDKALEYVLKALEIDPANSGAQSLYASIKRKAK